MKKKTQKKQATKQKKEKKTKSVAVAEKQNGKSLTMVNCPIEQKQLLFILQRTPKEHIYKRPGKGGGEWEYVTGVYVKKVLNYVFGWMWDFEIKEHGKENDSVWVLGRLTIKNPDGSIMIVKEQFGRADIKFKKEERIGKNGKKFKVITDKFLDYGNDLKAAATDALKKCASEIGIASDIYGKNEFKEAQQIDKSYQPPKEEYVEAQEFPKEAEIIPDSNIKVEELKNMLKGNSDEEKIAYLKKLTSITLTNFDISERHASILISQVLNAKAKEGK